MIIDAEASEAETFKKEGSDSNPPPCQSATTASREINIGNNQRFILLFCVAKVQLIFYKCKSNVIFPKEFGGLQRKSYLCGLKFIHY
jgi:hypothetical protein